MSTTVIMCSADIFLGLLAILFPPLPVWVKRGICSADSLINILLCTLGYLPGTIHAWYIIAKYPEPASEYEAIPQDDGEGRVYILVGDGRPQPPRNQTQSQQPKPQPKPNANVSYGTAGAPSAPSAPSAPASGQNAGEGSSDGAAPPSYAQVVAGDHKVQSQE